MPFGEDLQAGIGGRSEAQKYSITGADAVRQKFTGYQKDQETQLDFAEARMYENRHGRFTAVDPLLASGKSANPQTFNRYVYVLNNPLAYTDPTGLQVGDHKGKVYVNASETAFSNYEKDGYSLYEGGKRTINASDGWTYAIRQGGWTQVGKTNPNIADRAAQLVSDTVVGGGGTVYNALAGAVNATNWGANRLMNFRGSATDTFDYLPYYEPRTSGEAGASLATTFLSFYAGGAASAGRNPFFAGFSTESVAGNVLVDSNVIPRMGRNPSLGGLIGSGETPLVSYVTRPELQNAVSTRSGGLRGVPRSLDNLGILNTRPSLNLRINIRGTLPAGRGNFGDGIIGAQAIENNLPLVTSDRNLANSVQLFRGSVRFFQP